MKFYCRKMLESVFVWEYSAKHIAIVEFKGIISWKYFQLELCKQGVCLRMCVLVPVPVYVPSLIFSHICMYVYICMYVAEHFSLIYQQSWAHTYSKAKRVRERKQLGAQPQPRYPCEKR